MANADGATTSRWVAVGDDLASESPATAEGNPRSFATGAPLVVLVFHSQCGHCLRVAPDWARWTAGATEDVRVVALSNEAGATASAYVTAQKWVADTWVVEPTPRSPAAAMTSRTPWVFALDGNGTVVAHGHGDELERVAAALAVGPVEGEQTP